MTEYSRKQTQKKQAPRPTTFFTLNDDRRRDTLHPSSILPLQASYGNQMIQRLTRAGFLPSLTELHYASLAGNQALQRLVRQTRSNTPAVQRAVGFEFEIDSVWSYRKNAFGKLENLKKKDKIVEGEGFNLEADEMPGHSDMEFVTDAFPETSAGGKALAKAVTKIAGIIETLTTSPDREKVPAKSLATYGRPKKNRFLVPQSKPLVGKPQVTAGLRLDALDRLFEEVKQQPVAPSEAPNAAVVFGGQMAPRTMIREANAKSSGVGPVATAREETRKALGQIPQEGIGGPELSALVTQLVLYLVRGACGVPGYGKTIAGEFMGRTDFAKIFQLLPKTEKEYFQEDPDRFVNLVLGAARAASRTEGYQGDMSPEGAVFEGKLYNDQSMYGNNKKLYQKDLLPQLKRGQWLRGIVEGKDLLTFANYPGKKKHKEEIESLGGYGSKVDELSWGNDSSPAPIIEFRGLKELYAGLFVPFALDFFRYVHTINTGGQEGYPGQLLDMSQDKQIALIQHQGRHTKWRKEVVKNALKEIKKW